MSWNILLVLCLVLDIPYLTAKHIQFYRKDYTYFEQFDAYYKLHWDNNGKNINTAFTTCNDEGAKLFYPKYDNEWKIVGNLTKHFEHDFNVTEFYVGIHDKFHLGEFITTDGLPTPSPILEDKEEPGSCVVMDINDGRLRTHVCNNVSPIIFVCKKQEDESCPTIDKEYQFVKGSNKCYKINNKAKTWNEAMNTCFMEGAILAVIEDKVEADNIKNMLPANGQFYVGFRKIYGTNSYDTVKGGRLQDVYNKQYDNLNEECGYVRNYSNDLYTYATSCDTKLQFICEMDANY